MRIEKFKLKKNKSKIICLTAYSKNFAEEIDKYTDLILVGDSLGSVLYNFNSTRKVTLNMMIEHSKSVRMGITKSLMIVDMPYNTYKNKGLPPGPINSPGLDAIIAALEPRTTNYLYFVKDPDNYGKHVFNNSFKGHEIARKKYLRHIRENGFK